MPRNKVAFGVQAQGVGKASSELDKLRDKVERLRKQGAKGVLTGVAAGATVAAFNVLSQVVSAFTGKIGESIDAARADEASITRLGAALKANIPAWDGNTQAIERTIKSRMALGFSDDEQRDSLAKLVVATHDANKALVVQRTAMDLARLKNISLADAGDALTKVEGGQFRALKALGIVLKDGATATDALAAVQKAATGQADAYAKTAGGKLLNAQVKVNEAMEKFGYTILPAVADAATAAADGIDVLGSIGDAVSGKTRDYIQGLEMQTAEMLKNGATAKELGGVYEEVTAALADGTLVRTQSEVDSLKRSRDALAGSIRFYDHYEAAVTSSFQGVTDGAKEMAAKVTTSVAELVDALVKDASDLIDGFFDPIKTEQERHDARVQLSASIEEEAAARSAAAHQQASRDILSALEDESKALLELGSDHKLTSGKIDAFEADVRKSYAALGKRVPKELQAIIDKLRELISIDDNVTINVNSNGPARGPAHKKKAAGGPVSKGVPYTVGEQGSETFVPDSNGTIIPHGRGATTINNFNLSVTGNLDVSDSKSALSAMRRLLAVSMEPNATGRI